VTRFHPLVLVAVAIFAVLFAVALVVIWFSGRRAKPPSRPRRWQHAGRLPTIDWGWWQQRYQHPAYGGVHRPPFSVGTTY